MASESLFSQSDHLEHLSNDGDPLEVLDATVDFELFRGWLVEDLGHSDGSKGGRPPCHPVSMFTGLIVQAHYQSFGRQDGVHDPRPVVLDAVPRLRVRRRDARHNGFPVREHRLEERHPRRHPAAAGSSTCMPEP